MAEDKASSAPTIGWYLITREGDSTVRVHPGMHLGEDGSGKMSFQASDALVEFDIRDGTLILRVASDAHELEVPERGRAPTVYVDPQTQVRLSLLDTTVSVDTSSVARGPVGDTLEIRVVSTSGDAASESRLKAAPGPPIARFLRPVSSETQVSNVLAMGKTSDSRASERLDGAERISVQKVADSEIRVPEFRRADSTEAARQGLLEEEHPGAENDAQLSTESSPSTSPMARTARFAIFAVFVLVAFLGATLFIARTQTGIATAPVTLEPATVPVAPETLAPPDSPPPEDSAQSANPEFVQSANLDANPGLLNEVAALLDVEQLPDRETVDFALQSLKSLLLTYPNDPDVRHQLESLTLRLTSEAMLSYHGGDAIMAGRLIEQAALTGVAQETVNSAVAYLAAAQGEAARYTEALAAQAADAEARAGVPAVVQVERGRGGLEIPQANQPAPAPVARTPPGIYPQVAVTQEGEFRAAPVDPDADGLERRWLTPDLDAEAMSRPSAAAELPFGPTLSETAGAGVTTAFPEAFGRTDTDGALADSLLNQADDVGLNDADADEGLQLYPFDQLQLIRQKSPVYPRRAPDGADASVDLKLTVTETGEVRGVQVMSSAPDYFTRAAVRAVLDWKFEPVTEMGQPVPVRTVVRITFRG